MLRHRNNHQPQPSARANPPGVAESYCPHCGELLTPLLADLATQRLLPHPGTPGFGIACTGCMEQLVTTGLPFASKLNIVASSTETIAQANMVLDAVYQARLRKKKG